MSGSASTWPGVQESELESEFEQELETETESENFSLGGLGNVLGGLLGEGETTAESEFEGEFESEGEFEGEAFSFGSLWKRLKPLAKKFAPMVGTAILGPGVGTALGSLAASALGEGEFESEGEFEGEFESESEFEGEFEFEAEGESEAAQEITGRPLTESEALAEMMVDAASRAASESESEGMVGAAVVTMLSPRDRRALSGLLPDLIRGVTVLSKVLRRRGLRRATPAITSVVRRSVRDMKRHAASGRKVTRRTAAKATARQVRRVLGSPKVLGASLARNARATRAMKKFGARQRAVRG